MKIGTLRQRITLQQKTTTRDAEGNVQETWTDVETVWASVEPIRGREYFQAAAVNAENTVRFRIRYLQGITPTMQVIYSGRVFDIKSVIDVNERHREIELMCQEVASGG